MGKGCKKEARKGCKDYPQGESGCGSPGRQLWKTVHIWMSLTSASVIFLHNWAYKQRAFSAAPVSVWTLFFSLQKPLYYCFLFLYYSCQDGGVTMKNESHIRKVIVLLGETEASVLRWKILLEHVLLLNVNSLQIVYKLAPAQDVTVCEITFMPTVPLAVAKRYRGRGNAPPCCQNSKDISWGESTQHD